MLNPLDRPAPECVAKGRKIGSAKAAVDEAVDLWKFGLHRRGGLRPPGRAQCAPCMLKQDWFLKGSHCTRFESLWFIDAPLGPA